MLITPSLPGATLAVTPVMLVFIFSQRSLIKGMTLTGMKKHVGVLEQAGLVTTEKVGRVRTCRLGLRRCADVSSEQENKSEPDRAAMHVLN